MRRLLAALLVLAAPLGATALLWRERARFDRDVAEALRLERAHDRAAQVAWRDIWARAEGPFFFREDRVRLELTLFESDLALGQLDKAEHELGTAAGFARLGDPRIASARVRLDAAKPRPEPEPKPEPGPELSLGDLPAPPRPSPEDAAKAEAKRAEADARAARLLRLASAAEGADRPEEARAAFARAAALLEGTEGDDRHLALEGQARLAPPAEALDLYREALALDADPEDPAGEKHLEELTRQAVEAARKADRTADAPALVEAALGDDPEHLPERLRGRLTLLQGRLELELGQDAAAVGHLRRGCADLSGFAGADSKAEASALSELAQAEVRLGRYRDAAGHYRDATIRQEVELGANSATLAHTLRDQARFWLAHPEALPADVAVKGMDRAATIYREPRMFDSRERAQAEADLIRVAIKANRLELARSALLQVTPEQERADPEVAAALREAREALHLPPGFPASTTPVRHRRGR